MSIITFEGAERRYIRYPCNRRTLQQCISTRNDENGNILECSYRDIREDNHRRKKTLHICTFVKGPTTNTLTRYFEKKTGPLEEFHIDELFTRVGLLAGQMNLSLSFCESDEFRDFTTYAMACGAALLDKSKGNLTKQAEEIFPHHKRAFYRDVIVRTARSIHQMTLTEFTKLDYVCCAIDQGSILGRKSVDFVLESPFAKMEAYP